MAVKSVTGFDSNGQRLLNVGDPSGATDGANKQYVDNLLAGLSWKDEVKAASTGAITLATGVANGSTLDGISLVTGDRILLKDQASGAENGIWVVAATGAPSRATDADVTKELENATVFISGGTVNADRAYTQTATVTTPGTTAQTWVQFGAGAAYSAAASGGLTLSSNAFSILLDSNPGLVLGAGGIKVDYSVVVRKLGFSCVATTNPQTFNHNLGTLDIEVQVWEVSTGKYVLADVTKSDTNNISVDFGGAPTSAQYRVVVNG